MRLIDKLFGSIIFFFPTIVWYFLLFLVCLCYSERLNGRFVDAQLAGDWILVPAGVFGALTIANLVYLAKWKNK